MTRPHLRDDAGEPTLFDSFWQAAHWVWERRGTAKRAGFPFSEETVTETILLDIATSHPLEIQVVPFNKRREGRLGADWEWLFYDQDRRKFFRSLIQAKVLDDVDRQYAHIDRTIGNTGVLQIDRLRDTAAQRGIQALYAFYNHLGDASRVPRNACACCECLECWGCSVALADAVMNNLPDKSFDKLRRASTPWLCLLCPGSGTEATSETAPDRAAKGVQTLHRLASEFAKPGVRSPVPSLEELIRTEPPDYFAPLQEVVSISSPTQRTRMVGEISAQNPGVDGVVLLTDPRDESSK